MCLALKKPCSLNCVNYLLYLDAAHLQQWKFQGLGLFFNELRIL